MATEVVPAPLPVMGVPAGPRWKAWALAAPPLRSAGALTLIVAAALLIVSGVVHGHLWASGYRVIPTVGPLFLAQAIATPLIAVGVIITRWLVAVAVALATMVATVGGFVLAVTVGLFGFHDGFAAPDASMAFVIEVFAIVLLLVGGTSIVRGKLVGATRSSQTHHAPRTFCGRPNPRAGEAHETVPSVRNPELPARR
jgi:hypothetical protein